MERATAPIAAVFRPTGWNTVALENVTMDVADYKKEAAFYAALLGWTLREDDGRQAIMDIGPWGSCILRAAAPGAFASNAKARAAIRSFAWVIDRWEAGAVASALRERGLVPQPDNKGAFESFWVKDPDGWDLQICNNQGLAAARARPAARQSPTLPFAPTGWKTVWIDHVSYRGSNYKRSASFYANLLGWKPAFDEGTQIELMAGEVGDVICRGDNPFRPGHVDASTGAEVDHISWGIAPWDVESVRAALESRGLVAQPDTATAHLGPDNRLVPDDIYQAAYQSYHTDTPNGFTLQISWVTRDKRLVGAMADKPQALRRYPMAGP
jgi:catechol 2,3-dioxygenase-like lactoylglutathione lyase family enzyme